jgi:hypothetical protein
MMLGPDGSHLFVRREPATRGCRVRCRKIGFFLWCELINRLFNTGELHDHAGELVLMFRRDMPQDINRLVHKLCHSFIS